MTSSLDYCTVAVCQPYQRIDFIIKRNGVYLKHLAEVEEASLSTFSSLGFFYLARQFSEGYLWGWNLVTDYSMIHNDPHNYIYVRTISPLLSHAAASSRALSWSTQASRCRPLPQGWTIISSSSSSTTNSVTVHSNSLLSFWHETLVILSISNANQEVLQAG